MKTRDELPECPVATTVQLIGNKWKLLIIRNLLQRPWRFNELQRSLDGISQKVLTDSLRSMEQDGIVTRTVYAEVPPRVEYALSELGKSMRPILDSMQAWGEAYKTGYGQSKMAFTMEQWRTAVRIRRQSAEKRRQGFFPAAFPDGPVSPQPAGRIIPCPVCGAFAPVPAKTFCFPFRRHSR